MNASTHSMVPLASLEGAEIARVVSIAFFALFVYEWLITLDEEIKYFWTGPWTASRVLFFLNRYTPPLVMSLALACLFTLEPTSKSLDSHRSCTPFLIPFFSPFMSINSCMPAIRISLVANVTVLGIIQVILVLRVWYLFSDNRIVRIGIVFAFVLSYIISLYFAIIAATQVRLLPVPQNVPVAVGCQAARPPHFWRLFFPSLILHTLLYIMTAVRAFKNRLILKDAPVLKRLVRDGGFFYFVVFASVGFSAIGSFLEQYPRINIPVVFSDYLISITSIAISRVLFSIHSLADHLGSSTAWLLNNAELRRVGWRKGSTEGEIIVERWSVEEEHDENRRNGIELDDIEALKRRTPNPQPFMTKVGVFSNSPW